MKFTIIRPGGLKNDPASGNGVLTENNKVCGAINREDAAGLIVRALFSDNADNKVFLPLYMVAIKAQPIQINISKARCVQVSRRNGFLSCLVSAHDSWTEYAIEKHAVLC